MVGGARSGPPWQQPGSRSRRRSAATRAQRIEPRGDGNRHTITSTVKVSVPLVGGKAESFIAQALLGLVEAEVEVVAKVLAES